MTKCSIACFTQSNKCSLKAIKEYCTNEEIIYGIQYCFYGNMLWKEEITVFGFVKYC